MEILSYGRNRMLPLISLVLPIMFVLLFGSIEPRSYLQTIVPGLVGISILMSSLFTITGKIAQYRMQNIFTELSLTPLTRSEWLLSVFVWQFVLACVSFIVITGIGTLAFSTSINMSLWILPYLIFGSFLFVSLGIVIGSISRSAESSSALGNLVGLPMMMLTGAFFPVGFLPWYVQDIARALPLYYFNQGLGSFVVAIDPWKGEFYLVILALISILFFSLALVLFRWRER